MNSVEIELNLMKFEFRLEIWILFKSVQEFN